MSEQPSIRSLSLSGALKFIFTFRPGTSRKYAWVDYAKGIAIIFVTYRHVIYGLLYNGIPITSTLMNANEMLYGFRMPMFFFLSGLFFASSLHRRGGKNFMISKINTLLYPYLLWCFIQLTLQIWFSDYTNSKKGVENYLDILIHPRSMLQLWYLFALFNVTALYLMVDRWLKFSPWMQLLLGFALLPLKGLAGDISTLSDVMVFYVYFALGHIATPYFFKESVQEQLASPVKVLLLIPVFLLVQYYCMKNVDMSIYLFSTFALLGGLLVIMISFVLAKYRKLEFLQVIGHYSLYIYLIHVGIVFLLRNIILSTGIQIRTSVFTFILIAAGIFFSIVLYRICLLLKLNFIFQGPIKDIPRRQVSAS
ncbi:acyltransferase family protein [Chitinophaga niabensis]|uniref:Fucose 4-O-acetylase n=1 Tax=Chitinophaga niabensis TaxID=536979 RepID=A0A1N6EFB7_9BACT|nr:acyltransferase [Chitinophaga niabensis]SIN81686.1 Fucose 4-O-acetylase [Chitinophaga niabensis]